MITTKITGLSAQGVDIYGGLAYSNNDVAVTMYSDNSNNDGFKYIFNVTDGTTSQEYKFYVAPNAQLNGVFNAKTIFNELVPTPMVYNTSDILIHIAQPLSSNTINVNNIRIQCYEGWNVGGVFTEYDVDLVTYNLMIVYGSGKQNFIVMGTNETKPLALSQGYENTLGFNSETVANAINIPSSLQSQVINWRKISRSNVTGEESSAYSILSFINDDTSFINGNYPIILCTKFQFNLYDDTWTEIANFTINFTLGGGTLFHLPTGLKNLLNGGYIDQTTANDTMFWTVKGINNSDEQITAIYGYYIEDDCKYNPVHLYWLNQMGGIDSYSFIKKNERSIEVEKKRYKTYLGNYNDANVDNPFSTQAFSRSLTEREPIIKTFLNVQSNWLTESEFKYMRDLFVSKSVWMVDDNVDGFSVVPVVVEDNNYLMKRERNSRKYNQNIRLQIANQNETINVTATEYPIPTPAACTYYDQFTQITGTTVIYLDGVDGNSAHIIVNNATRDRYVTVAVYDSLGNTPTPGETYYVRIDYDTAAPSNYVREGVMDLGTIGTGGGTRTYLGGLQTPGTPIIASGVWGTHTTTTNNYFRLVIPGWSGTATYSGNIYVTVGFGNCP